MTACARYHSMHTYPPDLAIIEGNREKLRFIDSDGFRQQLDFVCLCSEGRSTRVVLLLLSREDIGNRHSRGLPMKIRFDLVSQTCLLLFIVGGVASTDRAQTAQTGALNGSVVDSSGAVVPGAEVR